MAPDDTRDELLALLWRLRDEEITPEQLVRLDQLICNDPESRWLYVRYLDLFASLKWYAAYDVKESLAGTSQADASHDEQLGADRPSTSQTAAPMSCSLETEQRGTGQLETSNAPASTASSPVLGFLSSAIQVASRPIVFSLIFATVFTLGGLTLMGVLPAPSWRADRAADLVGKDVPHRFVAQITHATADCQWGETDLPAFYGAHLQPRQRLVLTRGLAEITFDDGAQVILDGPSTFVIESSKSSILDVGRLTAKVPRRGVGFTVETPLAAVVDLGTEFGVEVGPQGTANVHVFVGEVSLDANGQSTPVKLRAGQAVLISPSGVHVSNISPDQTKFVRRDEFKARIASDPQLAFYRWLAHSRRMRRDPDLLAYYSFERQPSRSDVLLNRAEATAGRYPGRFGWGDKSGTRPTWATGRWKFKDALRFDRQKQQLVEIDDSAFMEVTGPLTVAMWLKMIGEEGTPYICSKMNDLGRPNDRYCFSLGTPIFNHRPDGTPSSYYGPRLGGTISIDGDSPLSNRNKDEGGLGTHTGPEDGWVHAAMTVRPGGGQIRLFKDGEEILPDFQVTYDPPSLPATSQPITLGGMIDNEHLAAYYEEQDVSGPFDIHNISAFYEGLLDEVAIFRRVLTADEIRKMYEAGKPN